MSSLTAWIAAVSCGSATSVHCSSGVVPVARPTSPYWFVEKVFETVRSPVGANSIDSIASRAAAVAGQAPVSGVTVASESRTSRPAALVTVISVSPLNSLTAPVTLTSSPIATRSSVLEEKTNRPSDAVRSPNVPPVPAVWIT